MLPKTLDTTNPEAVHRFIGGRRRYNAWRQFVAMWRRKQVAEMLLEGKRQCEIARKLNVHPSTICRDYRWLREESWRGKVCPCCKQTYFPAYLETEDKTGDQDDKY